MQLTGKLSKEDLGTLNKSLGILKRHGVDIRSTSITLDNLTDAVNRETGRFLMATIIAEGRENSKHEIK